jgi:glycosyltransferase involved in cell wall biosynthesis
VVSILTPLLNPEPRFFRDTVASVLAQTFRDFEYIVVEDPATDAPSRELAAEILAEFGDPRIRHVRNERRTSLVRQRNCAVELARGGHAAWIDADDVCEPGRIEMQYNYLRRHPETDVVGSCLKVIDENNRVIGARCYPVSHDAIVRMLPIRNPLAQPSVMLRAEALRRVGGYRYDRYVGCEDYELWCRLFRAGARFHNLPEPLTRYRIQPGQLKATRMRDQLRGTLDIKRMHFPDDRSLASLTRRWAETGLMWLPPRIVTNLFLKLHVSDQPLVASAPSALETPEKPTRPAA